MQGRGIGREALTQVCEQAYAEGVQRVRLEVAVDNDRALALYTSIRFVPVATEDYYVLPGMNSQRVR
jgi:ribosomal protein S18 acetylase RimI-like enzyme